MKALVKEQAAPGLWMKEVPIPCISDQDVLIKIRKVSICGTDVHIYQWDEWSRKNVKVPKVIGHEFVGEIVDMGKSVTGFKIGDRVVGEGHLTCDHCRHCLAGRRHLCVNTVGVGYHRDGCFAEYMALPAKNAFKVPQAIADEVAAIFDPLGNATHTALSFNLVGEDVLITGAGPIGIMSMAIAQHVGARHVVITDLNEYRLDLARKMGAKHAINISKTPLRQAMQDIGIQAGFDVAFEMSGSPHAMDEIIQTSHHGAYIALLGILPIEGRINWHQVIFKMLTIKGIYGREIFETWYKMKSMLESGLNIAPIITHHFAFEDFEKGFEAMISGQSGKVILSL